MCPKSQAFLSLGEHLRKSGFYFSSGISRKKMPTRPTEPTNSQAVRLGISVQSDWMVSRDRSKRTLIRPFLLRQSQSLGEEGRLVLVCLHGDVALNVVRYRAVPFFRRW